MVLPSKFASALGVLIFGNLVAADSFSLYAYGTGFAGPVFYADGLAYVGSKAPTGTTTASNITFTPSTSNAKIWLASLESPLISQSGSSAAAASASDSVFYIDPSSGAFNQSGFAPVAQVPDDAEYEGWLFYGNYVEWLPGDEGTLLAQFWGLEIEGEEDVWKLMWNSDSKDYEGAVPVVVKKRTA